MFFVLFNFLGARSVDTSRKNKVSTTLHTNLPEVDPELGRVACNYRKKLSDCAFWTIVKRLASIGEYLYNFRDVTSQSEVLVWGKRLLGFSP